VLINALLTSIPMYFMINSGSYKAFNSCQSTIFVSSYKVRTVYAS